MAVWTTIQFEAESSAAAKTLEERIQDSQEIFSPNGEHFSIRRAGEMVYVQIVPTTRSEREKSALQLAEEYADACGRVALSTANDVSNRGRAALYSVGESGLERVIHLRGAEHLCLADLVIRFEEQHGFRLRATASENHGGELNFGIKFYDATEGFDPMYETAKELEEEADVDQLDEEWWD